MNKTLKRGMPPSHPGEILLELDIKPLGVSITDFANNLGVTRKTISAIINGRAGISAEMALRLSKALNTSPELWINLQTTYDLWQARPKVELAKIVCMNKRRVPRLAKPKLAS